MHNVYDKHGIKGFLKGNGANCVKIAPETAIKFYLFDKIKESISKDPTNIDRRQVFLSGGISGSLTQTLIYPLDTVRIRLSLMKES